ncbi:hypothetical protein [Treponema denticola]|uniref:Uncharacterized protein n=1 Tax=Treponema denticola SP33 TaxID=999437 RepID=M2BPU7_TREDN|nr:hypothetical protein [Treponema denticola]EMB24029.1 hypothetical protein HMPREF9733_01478 [Treponema denticola SP33]
MMDKRTDSSYNHPHKKNAKSFAKAPCKALDIKPHICTKFTASQLHSFTASQLHSFTASQLKGTCVQIKQSPTTKFSHIKKYVLQIGTIHQKQNLIRGFQRGIPFGSAGTTSVASRSKEGVIGGEAQPTEFRGNNHRSDLKSP